MEKLNFKRAVLTPKEFLVAVATEDMVIREVEKPEGTKAYIAMAGDRVIVDSDGSIGILKEHEFQETFCELGPVLVELDKKDLKDTLAIDVLKNIIEKNIYPDEQKYVLRPAPEIVEDKSRCMCSADFAEKDCNDFTAVLPNKQEEDATPIRIPKKYITEKGDIYVTNMDIPVNCKEIPMTIEEAKEFVFGVKPTTKDDVCCPGD